MSRLESGPAPRTGQIAGAVTRWIHDRRQGLRAYLRARGLAPQRRGNYASARYSQRPKGKKARKRR